MAKQTINIGAAANDGTGDPIRTAFGKVNDNFTEIYTANTGVNTGDQNLAAYATTAAVAAGYQPLDSDLTAIAALTTTAYGRALLSTADAPTLRTAIGLGQTDAPTFLAQTLTGQSLTGTQATSLVDLATTWLSTTGTPTAIKLNVTDTASNAASKLMDLQVGGVSKVSAEKSGLVTSVVGFRQSATGAGIAVNANGNRLSLYSNSVDVAYLSEATFALTSSALFGWAPAGPTSGVMDLLLARDAAGILAQRNGTAKQTLRIYNTYTSATVYERAVMDWNGPTPGNLQIGTEFLGSGSGMAARPIDFVVGGTVRMSLSAASDLTVVGSVYTGSGFVFTSKGYIGMPSSGVMSLYNLLGNDFNRLQLGGTTSAFPAIKRNGTGIEIRFADDSTYTTINASDFTGYNGGVAKMYAGGAGVFQTVSTGYFAIASSATSVFAGDTYLSRSAPGVWQMGTSSSNATADLRLRNVIQSPGVGTTVTPASNGDLVFETTSNTSVTVKLKGSDGTVRSFALTLV